MCTNIFVELVNLVRAEAMWVHFATVTVHQSQLQISGYPRAQDMNIIKFAVFDNFKSTGSILC